MTFTNVHQGKVVLNFSNDFGDVEALKAKWGGKLYKRFKWLIHFVVHLTGTWPLMSSGMSAGRSSTIFPLWICKSHLRSFCMLSFSVLKWQRWHVCVKAIPCVLSFVHSTQYIRRLKYLSSTYTHSYLRPRLTFTTFRLILWLYFPK